MAEVVTLEGNPFTPETMPEKPILRDPANQLREIANGIEKGEWGPVGTFGLVIMGNTTEVFGGGEKFDLGDIVMLFHAGIMRLTKEVEGHGR